MTWWVGSFSWECCGETNQGSLNDFRVGRSLSVTPMAGWYMGAIGDIITPTANIRNVSWNNWTFGVGLTFF
jgi:hypothetical protein